MALVWSGRLAMQARGRPKGDHDFRSERRRHGELDSEAGQAIKRQLRAAFYADTDPWETLVWERAVETLRLANRGLAES